MKIVEAGYYSFLLSLNRVLGAVLQPLGPFYRSIQNFLLLCWDLVSFVGLLASISLVLLGCVIWLLDMKKVDGNQLVMAGLLIFCMLQCLMASLYWILFLI